MSESSRGGGQPVTCSDASAGALYAGSLIFIGAKADGATCQPRAGGLCDCAVTFIPDPQSGTGTYTAAGTTIEASLGTSVTAIDYCVSGARLTLRQQPSATNANPPVSVFTRQ